MQSALPHKLVLSHVRDVNFQHLLYKQEDPNLTKSPYLSTFLVSKKPYFVSLYSLLKLPTITMTISPRSITVIEGESQRLKGIREVCFDKDVMAFLQTA